MRRLIFAAAVAGFAALVPSAVLAAGLTEYVAGSEYAVGTCPNGNPSGSFAGAALASPTGPVNGYFNTTICHTPLDDTPTATATITGGTFVLHLQTGTVTGTYTGGTVGPGVISPLFPGSTYLCKEVFPVSATLSAPGTSGTATGQLTHIGVFETNGSCRPFAAKIAGVVMFA
jgi:hypothetical protein